MKVNDLLRQLQILDFALQDAILFLNSHPQDQNALSYYQKVQTQYNRVRLQMVQENGPLTNRDNTGKEWNYIHGKWPWEGEQ